MHPFVYIPDHMLNHQHRPHTYLREQHQQQAHHLQGQRRLFRQPWRMILLEKQCYVQPPLSHPMMASSNRTYRR